MKPRLLIAASLALFFTACTKNSSVSIPQAGKSPQDVVRMFVEGSASAKTAEDRRRLQTLCDGDMRRTFERMNEEAFRLIYLDSKVTILDLKFMDTKEDGNTAKVTYQLTVDNRQGTDPTREVNTREVFLTRANNAWFVENIRMQGSDQVAFTRGMLF